jgi:hypothetical protein
MVASSNNSISASLKNYAIDRTDKPSHLVRSTMKSGQLSLVVLLKLENCLDILGDGVAVKIGSLSATAITATLSRDRRLVWPFFRFVRQTRPQPSRPRRVAHTLILSLPVHRR